MTKSAKQILIEARELITPEERWTQEAYARNKDGLVINEMNPDAYCFCSLGAIERISGGSHKGTDEYTGAYDLLTHAVGGYVDLFNDTHTHAEVLAAFDRAIAIA